MPSNVVELKPDYLRDVELTYVQSQNSAAYEYRLRKGDLYLRIDIPYNLVYFNPYEIQRRLVQGGAKLRVRETIGLNVMMLDMEADHGNGD